MTISKSVRKAAGCSGSAFARGADAGESQAIEETLDPCFRIRDFKRLLNIIPKERCWRIFFPQKSHGLRSFYRHTFRLLRFCSAVRRWGAGGVAPIPGFHSRGAIGPHILPDGRHRPAHDLTDFGLGVSLPPHGHRLIRLQAASIPDRVHGFSHNRQYCSVR